LLAVVLPRAVAARAVVRAWQAGEAVLPLDPAAPAAALAAALAALRPTHLLDADGRVALPDGEPVAARVARSWNEYSPPRRRGTVSVAE